MEKIPLQKIIKKVTPEKIEQLIADGFNVNAKDEYDLFPLIYAAMKNHNPRVLSVIVKAGADVNCRGRGGITPLMGAGANRNPAIAQKLLEAGAEVNQRDEIGRTPIMFAAWNENPDVVRVLVEKGADINAIDQRKITPLMFAAMGNKNPEVVRFFLGKKVNVNARDQNGMNAILWAANNNNNPEILFVLLEGGADPRTQDFQNKSIFDHLKRNESNWDQEIFLRLKKHYSQEFCSEK